MYRPFGAVAVGEWLVEPGNLAAEPEEEIRECTDRTDGGAVYASEDKSDKEPHKCDSHGRGRCRQCNLQTAGGAGHRMHLRA